MGWLHSALVMEMTSARKRRSVEMKERNAGGQGMSYTADADAMIWKRQQKYPHQQENDNVVTNSNDGNTEGASDGRT